MATSQDVPHRVKQNSNEKTSDLQESKRSTGPDDGVNQRRLCANFDTMKTKIVTTIESAQKLVKEPEFIDHVQTDCQKMCTIDDDLKKHLEDMERDNAIIIAGETSAGKSSIINRILGKNILPVNITACTNAVCRIKYSDKLQVSCCNAEGIPVRDMFFENVEKMKTSLKSSIESEDKAIHFVDICFPVDVLKEHRTCIIVDTPGIGDNGQKDVAEMMMKYLPNALAFIFVLKPEAAGGLDDDRTQLIFNRVKENMETMVSFDPSDVIFLLNKWDSLNFKEDPDEESDEESDGKCEAAFFKNMVEKITEVWEDAREDHILKSSATKVKRQAIYKSEFEKFYELLKDVVTRKANRKVNGHLQFLKEFFSNCLITLSQKLELTNFTTEKNNERLNQNNKDLEGLEFIRKEALENIKETIDHFFEETSKQLFQYIHQSSFKTAILEDKENYSRFTIGSHIDGMIKKKTGKWERHHIGRIFEETVMKEIREKIQNIYEKINAIKKHMSGLEPPFDAENKIVSVLAGFIAPSGTGFVANFLLNRILLFAVPGGAVIGVSLLVGTVVSTAIALDISCDYDTFCSNAFDARKNALTKKEIEKTQRKIYQQKTEEIIMSFLDGELKDEIAELSRSIEKMKKNLKRYTAEEKTLRSLRAKIAEIKLQFLDSD